VDFSATNSTRQLASRFLSKATRPAILTENIIVIRFGLGDASSPTSDDMHCDPIGIGKRLNSQGVRRTQA
jgi:hypothetical protein